MNEIRYIILTLEVFALGFCFHHKIRINGGIPHNNLLSNIGNIYGAGQRSSGQNTGFVEGYPLKSFPIKHCELRTLQ